MAEPNAGESVLSAAHEQVLLLGSGISAEVVARRGYRTVTKRAELLRLGFGSRQALVPALLIPVWSVSGEIVFYQSRPETPRVVGGKAVKYETPAGATMALDVHPAMRRLLGDPQAPLWVTEGIKKGDALASRGHCAISLLGVWNWRGRNEAGGATALADWELVALKDRRVLIVFDSDVMLKPAVHGALERLGGFLRQRGAEVLYVYLPAGTHGEKVGVDDFLAAGHSIEEVLRLASSELRALRCGETERADPSEVRGGVERSQATMVLAIAEQAEVFRDALGEAYAAFAVAGHRETWPLRSGAVRRWLSHRFYVAHGAALRRAALEDAIGILEGRAQFEGEERAVWLRVAEGADGALHIDLGTPSWDAVRVTASGWEVVADPPVHFRRSNATGALPAPQHGGSLAGLRELLPPMSEDDFRRIVGWLVGALRPRGPYPVLAFIAEQGSGKSFTARMLQELVDPSPLGLRAMPHGERDLLIAARGAFLLAFDNLSTLPAWLSDALCRLATGAGWATRTLYTDAEETLFAQARPTMLTGIEDYIGQADLLDRALLAQLGRIPPERRRPEVELARAFEAARPGLFGALLDALVAALGNAGAVNLEALPRMADFATWVVAAEGALPWPAGGFLQALVEGAAAGHAVALEASPLTEPIVSLIGRGAAAGWHGTAAELLAALGAAVSEEARRVRSWPKSAQSLAGALRRLAPALREGHGISVEFEREGGRGRRRLIVITPGDHATGEAVRSVHAVRFVQPVDGAARADENTTAVGPVEGIELRSLDGVDAADDVRGGAAWEEVIA